MLAELRTQRDNTSKRDQTETQPQYGAKFLWLCCVQEVGWETLLCHLVSSSKVSVLISDFSFWQRYQLGYTQIIVSSILIYF